MTTNPIDKALERINSLLLRTPDAGLEMARIILLEEKENAESMSHRELVQDSFECGYMLGFREAVGLQNKSHLESSSAEFYDTKYGNRD